MFLNGVPLGATQSAAFPRFRQDGSALKTMAEASVNAWVESDRPEQPRYNPQAAYGRAS